MKLPSSIDSLGMVPVDVGHTAELVLSTPQITINFCSPSFRSIIIIVLYSLTSL